MNHPVCTIGYGGRIIDEFIDRLHEHEVEVVVDVRSSPYSRYDRAYNRRELDRFLTEAGFTYRYLGDLVGGKSDDWSNLSAQPEFKAGIEQLVESWCIRERICLMCAEKDPAKCHRTWLVGESLHVRGVPVVHIDAADTDRTHAEVVAMAGGRQMGLWE
jgi:uncharacterized protein (DUF488 family)